MMRRSIRNLHRDRITVVKPDGTVVGEDIPASVQGNRIFMDAAGRAVEIGYEVTRKIAGGVVETYIVEDPGFHQGMGREIPANYQMQVRQKTASASQAPMAQYNVSGPNARINIGSHDASNNIVVTNDTDELFALLQKALNEIPAPDERERVLDESRALQASVGSASFAERYQRFVASAAAHITILTPFIPALTGLLQRHT